MWTRIETSVQPKHGGTEIQNQSINQSVHCGDDMRLIKSMNGSRWLNRFYKKVVSQCVFILSTIRNGTSIKSETTTQMIVLQLTGIFHPSTFCSECSKNVVFVFRENYRKKSKKSSQYPRKWELLLAPCGVTCMPFHKLNP